jgi:hypothetical protein
VHEPPYPEVAFFLLFWQRNYLDRICLTPIFTGHETGLFRGATSHTGGLSRGRCEIREFLLEFFCGIWRRDRGSWPLRPQGDKSISCHGNVLKGSTSRTSRFDAALEYRRLRGLFSFCWPLADFLSQYCFSAK